MNLRAVSELLTCVLAVGVSIAQAPSVPAAAVGEAAAIAIDYPAAGSVFPPEFPPPEFLWRDPAKAASLWSIEVVFSDGSAAIRVIAPGERMRLGPIDPRCAGPTNALPQLTAEQADARTWRPDRDTWAAIERHSAAAPATVIISGYRDGALQNPVSRGTVAIQTSHDPVGAPIFYRDVPLRSDEAILHFQKAVDLDPARAGAQANLATLLAQQGRFAEAIPHFEIAIQHGLDNAETESSLGWALAMTGRPDEALSYLEKAVAAKPDALEYRMNLARTLAAKSRFQDAIPHFEKAAQLSAGKDPAILDLLAGVYSEVARYADAARTVRQALIIAETRKDSRLVETLKTRLAYYESRR